MRDIGRRARKPGAFAVQLVRNARHAVIGLRNAGGGKRIGRDDVGAGAKVGEVNVAHLLRLGEDEKIVVAAYLAIPGVEARAAVALLVEPERLNHGAHGAVENENALARELAQLAGADVRCMHGRCGS